MPKIQILSSHEAQKIAAGEVVERPASVIKELLENALDAGATQITVTIEDGGKKLIRVVDNGYGMSAEDARLSIGLHATSKIRSVDEVAMLQTFGFRGEALAALAAASRMTLITKESTTHEGIKLTIEQGVVIHEEPVAAQTGTIVEASDLFYSIPARQKFLKKRDTETRQIQHLFNAVCIAHPGVNAKLYADGALCAHYLPADDVYKRCADIVQFHTEGVLLPLCDAISGIELTGVVADHQNSKYDRTGIMIFVNKRWVKNTQLSRAVIRAYTNVLPPGRFPIAVIILTIPGTDIDVNVHPRKEEVQFMHPTRVEGLIYRAIKKALDDRVTALVSNTKPVVRMSHANSEYDSSIKNMPLQSFPLRDRNYTIPFFTHVSDVDRSSIIAKAPAPTNPSYTPSIALQQAADIPDRETVQSQQLAPARAQSAELVEQETNIIGQLFSTYILVETGEGMLLVDQHAAHEAILYEQFALRFHEVATVQLLFPEIITLAAHEWDTIEPYIDILHDNGIALEQFGSTQIRVTATPVHCKHTLIEELIRSMISLIHEHSSLDRAALVDVIHKKMRAQMACKAAVKAGDTLDHNQMKDLLKNLQKTENRLTCPHGRPTCWLISRYEIEKKFKRVG
jgi:DNA mismatch repair protein MutL